MRTKAAMVLLIALIALTACGGGSDDVSGGGTTTGGGGAVTVTTATANEVDSPVDGTWRMEGITKGLLRDAGFEPNEIAVVFDGNGAEHELASTIRLQDGIWQAFLTPDDGADVPAQSGTYTVDGDTIIMIDTISPATRYEYRWSIDEQDRLHIEVLSIENAPPTEGVDDSVFQFAFYESQPLDRIG